MEKSDQAFPFFICFQDLTDLRYEIFTLGEELFDGEVANDSVGEGGDEMLLFFWKVLYISTSPFS